jgi:hypothetical protein
LAGRIFGRSRMTMADKTSIIECCEHEVRLKLQA